MLFGQAFDCVNVLSTHREKLFRLRKLCWKL
jgi:hypothetical protein